ncbi:MAG: hypothetical protein GX777_05220 [Fastidiosipila sp.]|nr:hypothetical protein [Fastidiosipila sp.]
MKKVLYRKVSLLFAVILLCLGLFACKSSGTIESDFLKAENDEQLQASSPDLDLEKDEEYITDGTLGSHGGIVSSYDGYLGYGYNMITAAYYNPKDINSAHPVVDMNALAGENKVYIDYNTNFADPKTYILSSLKEYSEALSAKANVEGNFPLAGSIKANFGIDTSYQMTSNQRLATLQANLETRKDYIMENSPELLAKHVAGGFKTSVGKLSQNATDKAIKDFITKYGTHVLTNVTMGGRFDLNYLYTNKSGSESSDISASLQASYRYVKGSTDTNVKNAKKEIEENSNIKITTFGGSVTVDPVSIESAMASYSDWSSQVQAGKITLVDASEVIPIWEIVAAMDENYTSLSSAIKSYCEKEGVNTISRFKDTQGLPDPPKTYISDIYIGYGKSSAEAKGMLSNKGVLDENIVDLNLNENAGGNWIYLGYKKTTSKDKAITHILADYWSSARTDNIVSNGYEMQIIDSDLNRKAGGKYIYLYYTRDPKVGQPLTEIIYQHKDNIQGGSADGYSGLRCFTTGELMDLNMGTDGGDLIYLWFKRN